MLWRRLNGSVTGVRRVCQGESRDRLQAERVDGLLAGESASGVGSEQAAGRSRGDAVNAPAAAAVRDAVFVSYSHDDQEWRRKFTQMLAPMVRNRGLALWDDTHIPAGDNWRRDIDDGVRRAGAALLLVTASYLASRFVVDDELPTRARRAAGPRPVPRAAARSAR